MSEVKQFKLPDVGEGLTEADIVAWHVKPGDPVSINQVIVEIETAKAVVELPSPYEGVVTGLLVDEGTTVDVGTPIIAVDISGGPGEGPGDTPAGRPAATPTLTPAAPAPAGAESPLQQAFEPGIEGSPAPKIERQAVLVGYGVKLGPTKRRQRKPTRSSPAAMTGETTPPPSALAGPFKTAAAPPAPVPGPAETAPPYSAPAPGPSGAAPPEGNGRAGTRPAAKPPVRKLAKDLGVDLAGLAGTGPNGTITREDVQAAVEQPAALATPSAPPATSFARPVALAGAREERIPVRGVRKHTAAAVARSAFTAPHVTEFLQVDATATMEAVGRLREVAEFAELRVSPLLLVAKALLLAVARHPMINSSWDEDAHEIVVKHYVNLGIAAATDRGLIVPNVKDAHALSLPGLAGALAELTATTRAGKAQPADLTGGTITITNVGVFGVDAGTPILTPGEAAILAFGQVRPMPWVHEGELAVRQVTTLSLSFDHRIVDGDLGSAVLRDVGAMITDPVRMLAWS
jgi:2-oxoisovalerate dehydrogenase E2 component (dihydrolipoyl transacylase)